MTRLPRFDARPLLPASLRWPAAALTGLCVIVVGTLGVLTARQSQPDSVDARIDGAIMARLGAHLHADGLIVDIGDQSRITIICLLLVLACLAFRRLRSALLIVMSVLLASTITENLLKPLSGRTLHGGLTFPSGHETAVSCVAVAVIIALLGPARPPLPAALRWALVAVALAATAAIAPALIAVQYHYFTDTVGGAAVGTGTVLGTALVLDALAAWLTRRRAARASSAGQTPAGDGMSTAARELPRA